MIGGSVSRRSSSRACAGHMNPSPTRSLRKRLEHRCIKGSPGPRRLPFGPGTEPVSGQSYETAAGRSGLLSRFPVAFRPPAFASWTILSPRGVGPSLQLAYGPTPGPRRGFPRSARSRPDRGGCSLYPGATVFTRPAPSHRPPLPHLSGQPCPRRYIPSPRVSMSRHQREFTCVHSSGLPLACSPRTGVWRDFRVIPGRWHRAGKVFPLRVR